MTHPSPKQLQTASGEICYYQQGKGPALPLIHGSGPGVTGLDTVSHLAAIKAPTLINWGRDDRVSPLDIALLPMRLIPNAELHVFPNCGHWAMIECKEAFEAVSTAFLRQ